MNDYTSYLNLNDRESAIMVFWNQSATYLAPNEGELLSIYAKAILANSGLFVGWHSITEPLKIQEIVIALLDKAVDGRLKNHGAGYLVNRDGLKVVVSLPSAASMRWFREALVMGDIVPSPVLIAEQFTWIDEEIAKQSWSSFDRVFGSVSTMRLNTTSLLTLLRGTFSVRSKITEWLRFKSAVYATLNSRSLDASALMRGL